MLSPKRGAGGGASETDGSGQQQVQTAHHHRRTLEKGAIIHSIDPFLKGMNPQVCMENDPHGIMVPIEPEQNCEIGNKMFLRLLGMDAIIKFVLLFQIDVFPSGEL